VALPALDGGHVTVPVVVARDEVLLLLLAMAGGKGIVPVAVAGSGVVLWLLLALVLLLLLASIARLRAVPLWMESKRGGGACEIA
jgi:hypothetical protein